MQNYTMRSYQIFCWTAIILSSLSLAAGEQTKPQSQLPANIETAEVDQKVQAAQNQDTIDSEASYAVG